MARKMFISFVDSVSSLFGIGIGKRRSEEELNKFTCVRVWKYVLCHIVIYIQVNSALGSRISYLCMAHDTI